MRNAWRVFGSSSQSEANHDAYPVVSPFGASTSIHWSPFVTSPIRTPVSCKSCIIRVSGDAAHGFPSTTRLSFCLSGYVWISSLALLPSRLHDHLVGTQRLAMLGEVGLERLRDLLPLHQHVAQVERVAEHPVDPLAVNRRVGSIAVLVLVPLLIDLPQRLGVLGVVGVHPLRETLDEHRQAQERSRDLDERQPFGVVLGDGHSLQPLLFRDSVDQVVYMVSRIFVCVFGVLSKDWNPALHIWISST